LDLYYKKNQTSSAKKMNLDQKFDPIIYKCWQWNNRWVLVFIL